MPTECQWTRENGRLEVGKTCAEESTLLIDTLTGGHQDPWGNCQVACKDHEYCVNMAVTKGHSICKLFKPGCTLVDSTEFDWWQPLYSDPETPSTLLDVCTHRSDFNSWPYKSQRVTCKLNKDIESCVGTLADKCYFNAKTTNNCDCKNTIGVL